MPVCLLATCAILLAGCGGADVELRRFPYPYQAAIAISSDVDETTIDELDALYAAISGRTHESGLGLEFASSFWFYNEYLSALADSAVNADSVAAQFIGQPDSGFAWFVGLTDSLSEHVGWLRKLVRGGHLDCLHSYGHFKEGGFVRRLAAQAVDEMRQHGLRTEVFINHNGPQNPCNMGPGPNDFGDDPGRPEYHADLTVDSLGVVFLWRGRLTHAVGQSGDFSFMNTAKVMYEWLVGQLTSAPEYPYGNDLIELYELDDGRRVYEFTRFYDATGDIERTDQRALAHQISRDVINELIENRGYMIVYTHLGKNDGPPYIMPEMIDALRVLKDKQAAGELLVTTPSRLLRYYLNHRSIVWHSESDGEQVAITIDSLVNEVEGAWVPSLEELQGLTFYVPEGKRVVLRVADRNVPVLMNKADYTGRRSVSLPWVRLGFPVALSSEEPESQSDGR
jgi:hypothetical protein